MKKLKYVLTSFFLALTMLLITGCQGDFNFALDFSSCSGCSFPMEKEPTNTPTYTPSDGEIFITEMDFIIYPKGVGYATKLEAIIETQGLPEKLIFKLCNNENELTPISRSTNVLTNQYTFTINEELTNVFRLYKGSQVGKIYAIYDGEEVLICAKEFIFDSDYTTCSVYDGEKITHILIKENEWSDFV